MLIFFTEISGIGFYWYNKYSGEISEKSLEQVTQNSAVKLFWNFKNKLLSGRRSHQFEFSVQVNSMFANSENKSRLPIVLFFERYFLVLEALWIAPNLALTSNDLFLGILKYSLAVLVQTPATYFDVLQWILNGSSCCTLLPIQGKGFGIVSYLVLKLR